MLLDAGRSFRRTLAIEPKTARVEAVVAFRRHDFVAGRQALGRALAIDPRVPPAPSAGREAEARAKPES